jgi:ABC-type Fe3+ transport system substrate-binding protein
MHGLLRGLLVLMVLGVAACTPGTRPAEPSAAAPSGASAAAQPEAKPAWQVQWEQTLAAARQEGKVIVVGPPGDTVRRQMLEGFRKEHPDITLEWVGGRTAESAAKIEAERRGGIYAVDVFIGGTTTANTQVKPTGAMAPIRPILYLPEALDTSKWLDNRLEFSDKDELNLVFITVPKTNVIYDPRHARHEDLDELTDLLDPRWKGKIIINDPTLPGAGNQFWRWSWEMLGAERAPEFLRTLRDQGGIVDRDLRRQIEWLAHGRYPILLSGSDAVSQQLQEQGLKLGFVVEMKEYGTSVTASFGSLMRLTQPPNPNAQVVFLNWLLTKDGQTAYSHGMEQPSRRLDVPTDHLSEETRLRPGAKYWQSYYEQYVGDPPGLSALFQELFSR